MPIPLLDSRGRPTGEVLEREQFHRFPTPPAEERRMHPAAHVIIYDSEGQVLEQKRAQTKRFLPGAWLPIHGGHIDSRDLHRENGHYVLGWRRGAIREIYEELGIAVPRQHLKLVDERIIDFSEKSEFENKTALKVYSVRYEEEQYGPIRLHHSEIEDYRWGEPTFERQHRLLRGLGEPYALEMAQKIVAGSKRITRKH